MAAPIHRERRGGRTARRDEHQANTQSAVGVSFSSRPLSVPGPERIRSGLRRGEGPPSASSRPPAGATQPAAPPPPGDQRQVPSRRHTSAKRSCIRPGCAPVTESSSSNATRVVGEQVEPRGGSAGTRAAQRSLGYPRYARARRGRQPSVSHTRPAAAAAPRRLPACLLLDDSRSLSRHGCPPPRRASRARATASRFTLCSRPYSPPTPCAPTRRRARGAQRTGRARGWWCP